MHLPESVLTKLRYAVKSLQVSARSHWVACGLSMSTNHKAAEMLQPEADLPSEPWETKIVEHHFHISFPYSCFSFLSKQHPHQASSPIYVNFHFPH